MRILFITNNFPPLVDGVGDYTYNLAKKFAQYGHAVTVICRHDIHIEKVSRIEILPIVYKWDRHAGNPIVNVIKKKAIEIVILQYVPHSFHPKGLPIALINVVKTIKQQNIKLFTFCHEVTVQPEKGNLKRTLLSYMMKYITKKILEQSDYIATNIEFYKTIIQNILPIQKKISIIPIASNIPDTSITDDDRIKLRTKIAKPHETVIAFFGMRNIASSLQAIKNLQNKGEKIRVLFIGKTSQLGEDQLPNNYYSTGILDIKDINPYFKISDIFMLPENITYGCSFKSGSLATALQNGLPVITNKGIMTSPEMIDRENIYFTDFNNETILTNTLLTLVHDSNMRKTIGENARKLAKKKTWDNIYESYIEMMK